MSRPIRIAAALLPALSALALAAPLRAETLAGAIDAAYRNNPQLLAQRAATGATNEQLQQAKAAYGPTVTGQIGRTYSYQKADLGNSTNRSSGTITSYTGSVQQPLFTSGRLSSAVRVARASIDIARENLRQAEAGVVNAVVTAYVSVRRDVQLLAIARDNLDLLAQQRSDTDTRLQGREATATDLQQTQVRHAFALARVKEAAAALEVSRGQYLLAVGALPGDLAPEPSLAGMPISIEQAYGVADANNPRLLAALGRERASRASIGGARAEFGPIVALQASGGRDTVAQLPDSRREYFSGGVVATVPVFNSGLSSSRVREAQKRNDADWFTADQARREVRQAIAAAWDRLAATRATIGDYRAAVRYAEEAYAGAREQERAGVRTTLDVLDQTRDLLDARTALAQAQASEYLGRATLLANMGVLEAERLTGTTPDYDADHALRSVADVLVPPWQPVLHAADALLQGPLRDRPARDAANAIHKPGDIMPPAPETR